MTVLRHFVWLLLPVRVSGTVRGGTPRLLSVAMKTRRPVACADSEHRKPNGSTEWQGFFRWGKSGMVDLHVGAYNKK